MSQHKHYKTRRSKELHESRVGEVFNELTVIQFVGNSKYKFQCTCGETCVKNYYDVREGKTKSCGHLKLARRTPNSEGQKFNKLLAIKELDIVDGQRLYLFRCDCGNEVERLFKEVKRGKLKSCGCGVLIGVIEANTTHGMSKSRIYNIYQGMLRRCVNKKDHSFPRYGGRGISVCDEWSGEKGFEKFHKWSLSNGYEEHLSIDRIDNDGSYEPSNCRWADHKTQLNNTSYNLHFSYNNKTQTLAQWSEELDLIYDSLWKRIYKYNYSFEKAITYKIDRIRNT